MFLIVHVLDEGFEGVSSLAGWEGGEVEGCHVCHGWLSRGWDVCVEENVTVIVCVKT